MTLLQKLIAMQSQLSEATIEGELDQFIDDQHEDLHGLLDQAIRVLGRETELLEKLSKSIYHPQCTSLRADSDGYWRCTLCGKQHTKWKRWG
jgi:hypothetical protein